MENSVGEIMKRDISKTGIPSVDFYAIGELADNTLEFVVLQTRYHNKWIFVRHHERKTWEIPGGHIDAGETSDEAARRELIEETGSIDFSLEAICDYSVTINEESRYGRLYHCEVRTLGALGESEIEEVKLYDELPEDLTYAAIQPHLFSKVEAEMKRRR